jgi:hypothetical protein
MEVGGEGKCRGMVLYRRFVEEMGEYIALRRVVVEWQVIARRSRDTTVYYVACPLVCHSDK